MFFLITNQFSNSVVFPVRIFLLKINIRAVAPYTDNTTNVRKKRGQRFKKFKDLLICQAGCMYIFTRLTSDIKLSKYLPSSVLTFCNHFCITFLNNGLTTNSNNAKMSKVRKMRC